MSTNNLEAADVMMCSASCGAAEVDNIKLKDCTAACDLVRYAAINASRNIGQNTKENA